jgi:sulfite oxidase
MLEVSLFSGITRAKIVSPTPHGKHLPGDKVTVKCSGWAWSGGGRSIVRVDITSNNGETWVPATLKEGSQQKPGRAWAWTFWECEVEAVVGQDKQVHLACKALDQCFNVQPEDCRHIWNVRGLGNNSWYRTTVSV